MFFNSIIKSWEEKKPTTMHGKEMGGSDRTEDLKRSVRNEKGKKEKAEVVRREKKKGKRRTLSLAFGLILAFTALTTHTHTHTHTHIHTHIHTHTHTHKHILLL
jgi:hypothetical protein